MRLAFAGLHLLALGVGLGSVHARGRALRRGDVPAVLHADSWWGIAAVLWLVTGLVRAFGGLEKGSAWYLASPAFHLKMTLFAAVVLLELWPMLTFLRWRRAPASGAQPDLGRTRQLARVNDLELLLTLVIPFVAYAMAHGWTPM